MGNLIHMQRRHTAILVLLMVSRFLVATAAPSPTLDKPTAPLSELAPQPSAKTLTGVLDGVAAGLLPNTGMDCTRAFQAAMEVTRLHPGTTLRLKAGDYHFWRQYAAKRDHYQSNTDAVVPKSYALLLDGQQGTVIDGCGATIFSTAP